MVASAEMLLTERSDTREQTGWRAVRSPDRRGGKDPDAWGRRFSEFTTTKVRGWRPPLNPGVWARVASATEQGQDRGEDSRHFLHQEVAIRETTPTRMALRPLYAAPGRWAGLLWRCVRRGPEVLAYRLVEGQKGSESRGRVGPQLAGGRVGPGGGPWLAG
jgi:hypothetical protein